LGDLASLQAVTRVNAEQASKRVMRKPTRLLNGEGCYLPRTNLNGLDPGTLGKRYIHLTEAEISHPYCLLCHNFYQVTVLDFGVVSSAA